MARAYRVRLRVHLRGQGNSSRVRLFNRLGHGDGLHFEPADLHHHLQQIDAKYSSGMPYWVLAIFYADFYRSEFTGVKTSARINDVLAAGMSIVVVVFFVFIIRFYGPTCLWREIFYPAFL